MRVLMWPAGMTKRQDNPYASLLASALIQSGIDVEEFRPKLIFPGGTDALIWHIHWPDSLLNEASRAKRLVRVLVFGILVSCWRLRRRKIIWTVHNLRPHGRQEGPTARLLYLIASKGVSATITLSKFAEVESRRQWPELSRKRNEVVAHGLYEVERKSKLLARQQLEVALGVPSDRSLVVCIGRIQPYKGVESLVELADSRWHILIAGSPIDEDYAASVVRLFSDEPDVTVYTEYLNEKLLSCVLSAADLAVLPYRNILQSGSAVQCLTYDIPVVTRRTSAFAELAAEAGEGWVNLYETLVPRKEDIVSAFACESRGLSCQLHASDQWEWRTIAERTGSLYRSLARVAL